MASSPTVRLLWVVLAVLAAGCAGTASVPAGAPVGREQCPPVVDSSGQIPLIVSISNQSLLDVDPVVVAVTIDGSTVICEVVPGVETETYVEFPIGVTPEPHTVGVEAWWDSDPDEAGFEVARFSTSRELDPMATPHLIVNRRHVPPEGATVNVVESERPPGA